MRKYLHIPDIDFAYGRQAILAALSHPEGQAISYRFKRDDFHQKKLALKEEGNKKFSRLLSLFAYGLFFLFLRHVPNGEINKLLV
jgi:hypothetical protein